MRWKHVGKIVYLVIEYCVLLREQQNPDYYKVFVSYQSSIQLFPHVNQVFYLWILILLKATIHVSCKTSSLQLSSYCVTKAHTISTIQLTSKHEALQTNTNSKLSPISLSFFLLIRSRFCVSGCFDGTFIANAYWSNENEDGSGLKAVVYYKQGLRGHRREETEVKKRESEMTW